MNDEPVASGDESLFQFVYQFPVAVMRMSGAGAIDLMSPARDVLDRDHARIHVLDDRRQTQMTKAALRVVALYRPLCRREGDLG